MSRTHSILRAPIEFAAVEGGGAGATLTPGRHPLRGTASESKHDVNLIGYGLKGGQTDHGFIFQTQPLQNSRAPELCPAGRKFLVCLQGSVQHSEFYLSPA